MAQLLMILGDVDDAVRMSEDAIRRAESLGDFGSLAFVTGQSLPVLAICGRFEAVLKRAEAFVPMPPKRAQGFGIGLRGFGEPARGLSLAIRPAATELPTSSWQNASGGNGTGKYIWQGLLAQLQGKAGATTTRSRRSRRVSRSPSKPAAIALVPPPGPGRHPRRARPRGRRSRLPRSPPHRAGPGRAHLRAPGRARAGQAPSAPAAPPKPTLFSRPRFKAFRRRRKCPRSPKRRRCWRRWRSFRGALMSSGKPGFAEALDDALEIGRVLVRQDLATMFERKGRIDAHQVPATPREPPRRGPSGRRQRG